MDSAWVRDVLSSVVTDARAVSDLWRDGERVGIGVSLDELETEGNAAELSIFSQPEGDEAVCTRLLSWAADRGQTAARDHLDVPDWCDAQRLRDLLERCGYHVGYKMFNMESPASGELRPKPRTALPNEWTWQVASRDHARGYYDTVSAAWRGLPGAFVTPFEHFCQRLDARDERAFLLLSNDSSQPVAGFARVRLRDGQRGEVAAIGRHPAYRGRGLGEHLLARALARLEELGANSFALEVAAANRTGLALYHNHGFEVVREMTVFRRSLSVASQPAG